MADEAAVNDETLNAGERAQPHPRNQLNDLSGREWLYALRSVALEGQPATPLNDLELAEWAAHSAPVTATRYPTRGPASLAHAIRRQHPSPKPPQIMGELISFFTRRGGRVLDPFAGSGATLLACAMAGRSALGVELVADYIDLYHTAAAALELPRMPLLQGDARQLAAMPALADAAPFDLLLSDPPYAGMLSRPRTGQRGPGGRGAATPFSTDAADLGNLPPAVFLDTLAAVIAGALPLLRPGGHVVLFIKDLQPTAEHHNMLHADVVSRLSQLSDLRYRGLRIWYDQTLPLYPFGYPYVFVANQVHQFILVFQHQPPTAR